MTFDDATARVRTQGGFDTSTSNISTTDVQGWIQDRYKQAVADARYRLVELAVGNTVANQQNYALDTSVVEVLGLKIAGVPYKAAGTREVWDLDIGNLRLSVPRFGGVFTQEYESDGTVDLAIYPTPDDSGDAITALCAVEPDDWSSGTVSIIPTDLQEAIHVFGPIATGLALIDERLDSATYFENAYSAAVQKLGARRKGRINAGPVQIGVFGYHWK